MQARHHQHRDFDFDSTTTVTRPFTLDPAHGLLSAHRADGGRDGFGQVPTCQVGAAVLPSSHLHDVHFREGRSPQCLLSVEATMHDELPAELYLVSPGHSAPRPSQGGGRSQHSDFCVV